MKKSGFCLESYAFESGKLRREGGPVRLCFLSDLHGKVFGRKNQSLLQAIAAFEPDGILVGGDMVIGSTDARETMDTALELLQRLADRYPVWYALGNHEQRMMQGGEAYGNSYQEYERQAKACGIRFLHNESCLFTCKGNRFRIYGLELESVYYRKPFSPKLYDTHVAQLLGEDSGRDHQEYRILLAHNPKYGDAYLNWGADLTLSGHYHGGLVRFSQRHGLISPQFQLFPSYCCGDFSQGDRRMVVSAGLGEHTLPLRICDPRVLIQLTVYPSKER